MPENHMGVQFLGMNCRRKSCCKAWMSMEADMAGIYSHLEALLRMFRRRYNLRGFLDAKRAPAKYFSQK